MTSTRRGVQVVLLLVTGAVSAAAQERPFLFSVSTTDTTSGHASIHYEAGFGERAFDLQQDGQPEQRIGLLASLGDRWTLAARVGLSVEGQDARSSQQAELLYNLRRARGGALAVGMGVRHESAGTNVLTGRVAAARRLAEWRVDGNLLFEKPMSIGRDAVDLITTFGFARRVSPAMFLGIEAIGEDLEGFWEADEAEGGARLLVGPSIRFAPPSRPWQLSVAGGPVVHATRSAAMSEAVRALPNSGGRNGYAVRAALSYRF